MEITAKDKSIILSNVYAPNDDRPGFFIDIMDQINRCNPCENIVSGDFNLALKP